jgi:actin-related protein
MDMVWLDESNPESIILAVVKCLELSSMEVRKDVISNLVFCGDGMVLVPDLARRVVERLRNILDQTAEPLEGPTTTTSDLTLVQPSIHTLTPLFSAIRAVSTLPHRPDMVSWIGASLWSTVRHRYDDEDVYVDWTFAS